MRRNRHLKSEKSSRGREYAEMALAELERQYQLALTDQKRRTLINKIQGWRLAIKRWSKVHGQEHS